MKRILKFVCTYINLSDILNHSLKVGLGFTSNKKLKA